MRGGMAKGPMVNANDVRLPIVLNVPVTLLNAGNARMATG